MTTGDHMMATDSDSSIISKYFICFVAVFVIIVFSFQYISGNSSVRKGDLCDTDGYTRLNRVIQLQETGKWYDSVNARSNAPYGESMHWTRPLDVLLLAGAWLTEPFTDFKTGLFWWSVLISPFLLALSLIILPWSFRPVLSHDSTLVSLCLYFNCDNANISHCPA